MIEAEAQILKHECGFDAQICRIYAYTKQQLHILWYMKVADCAEKNVNFPAHNYEV